MRTLQENTKKADAICIQANLSLFDKIKELMNIQYNTHNYDKIICPYCGSIIENETECTENKCVEINLNCRDEIWYYINMPCCGFRVYVTQDYISNDKTEVEYYIKLREQLYTDVEFAEAQYYNAKHKYKTICDIIYNKEHGWE